MNNNEFILKPQWIITCEEKNQTLSDHAVHVKAGRIFAILPTKALNDYAHIEQIDLPNHALLPGLINAHTHIAMNIFKGLADDLPLMTWLTEHIWPAEKKWVSDAMVYDASLLAMGEMIRGGTTCFNDMYFFPFDTAKAAEVAGLRAHIGITIINFPTAWAANEDEYFAKGMEFYKAYENHPTIKPTLAPQGTYTVKLEALKRIATLSKTHNMRVNIHCQESLSDIEGALSFNGDRPLRLLEEAQLLNPQLIAIHMTQLNEEDLALIYQHKPHLVHCPESNMKLASGICPVSTLLANGVNVALGTDGAASNNDLDMLGEMQTAAFLGKLSTQVPTQLPAEMILRMATLNGAKALGIDHETGSLTVGKSADMIAIDLNQLETQPVYNPISQIVYAASRNQVTDVWVAGKVLLKNRELQTLEEKALLEKAVLWRDKIKNTSFK